MTVAATPSAKMVYLIQRREERTRSELIMHWYKNHMPAVIDSQVRAKALGRPYATKYIAQLFDTDELVRANWDGLAQLWYDQPLQPQAPNPEQRPSDTFVASAEPYGNWALREYVVIDGNERLGSAPLSLNEPFPSTRSGFHRINFFVTAKDGVDSDEFLKVWLDVHAANAAKVMPEVGGFHYVINQSFYPSEAPYSGMAELYFENAQGYQDGLALMPPDDLGNYIQDVEISTGSTEMVGIP